MSKIKNNVHTQETQNPSFGTPFTKEEVIEDVGAETQGENQKDVDLEKYHKAVQIVVCLTVGAFGVHRILMRRKFTGYLMLLFSLFFLLTFAPLVKYLPILFIFNISFFWSLIDVVRIARGKLVPKEKRTWSLVSLFKW